MKPITLAFACPSCCAVGAVLLRVRYCVGLADLDPRWLCPGCLDDLREQAAAYERGAIIDPSACVWGIEIVGTREAPTSRPAVASPKRSLGGVVA